MTRPRNPAAHNIPDSAAVAPAHAGADSPAGDGAPNPGVSPAGPRTWTIEFPPGMELLTANNRMHRYPKARRIKALKDTAWGEARMRKLPQIKRADVLVTYHPPAHRGPFTSAMIRDADALAPTAKALLDGLTLAGVFADDRAEYVRRVSYEFGPKSERGLVALHITEVTP